MSRTRSVELDVYVEEGCHSCGRAREIAQGVEEEYPQVSVRLIDVARSPQRDADVFAVPTFVLNGKIVSLGNPRPSDLRRRIDRLLARRREA